jgi:prepilin-type N-terminal cleavage/methylation domain-containing protein
MAASERFRKTGMTLTELLCVVGIIAFLAALDLSTIAKVFMHIKKFLKGF